MIGGRRVVVARRERESFIDADTTHCFLLGWNVRHEFEVCRLWCALNVRPRRGYDLLRLVAWGNGRGLRFDASTLSRA